MRCGSYQRRLSLVYHENHYHIQPINFIEMKSSENLEWMFKMIIGIFVASKSLEHENASNTCLRCRHDHSKSAIKDRKLVCNETNVLFEISMKKRDFLSEPFLVLHHLHCVGFYLCFELNYEKRSDKNNEMMSTCIFLTTDRRYLKVR